MLTVDNTSLYSSSSSSYIIFYFLMGEEKINIINITTDNQLVSFLKTT